MRHRFVLAALALVASSGCLADPGGTSERYAASDEGVVAVLGAAGIDTTRTTHLLVIGYSHGQGTQFAQAAMARAYRYRELYPDHQVVFFGAVESGGSRTDADVMAELGAKVISDDPDEKFYDETLLLRMQAFESLASFDFYGHSSPWAIGVESTGPRLATGSTVDLTAVRGSFTSDAYATLNGCNAGRELAPVLSEAWQIPVSGALTGSNFQALHTNGKWYVNDPGRAPSTEWASANGQSYTTSLSCSKGACLRLKPEDAPYHGYWGNFDGGLGHYQFFCNDDNGEVECARRMALSLVASVSVHPLSLSSSREEFEDVVLDWLCPNDASSARFDACKTELREAALTARGYSSFRGIPLECTDAGCDCNMVCEATSSGDPKPGTCSDDVSVAEEPMAQVGEYRRYMAGFDVLRGESPDPGPTPPPASGPIGEETLGTWPVFEVGAAGLNCRETAYTGSVVVAFARHDVLFAERSTADRPRVVTDSRGKPWLLVRREGEAAVCYVSASYEFIRPKR